MRVKLLGKRIVLLSAVLMSSLAAECEVLGGQKDTPPPDADTDTDTDSDSDADADTDADTDADADTHTLLDTTECDEPYATDPPSGACVTDTISCGDTVYATNTGGSTLFSADGQFEQCSGSASGSDLDGPERVYKLNVPSGIESVYARLESCEASWLFWYRGSQECPSAGELVTCSYPTDASYFIQDEGILVGEGNVMYFIVEGFQNEGGNFSLHVDCYE